MKNYEFEALKNQKRANKILSDLRLVEFWEERGCRANVIGSLAMGLLVKHPDIDIHVYSRNLTEEKSFAMVSELAKNPRVKEIRCINGLHTDERCIAWHLSYEDDESGLWQIDIIHIEEGTRFDGYFEEMARRINAGLTPEERDTILRLKYEMPDDEEIHGVEYYQAVMEYGVSTLDGMREWVRIHRNPEGIYWMPGEKMIGER